MKRHVQETGVRQWAGGDLIDLQAEPLKVLDTFFEEYGGCILRGCEITASGDTYGIQPGLVALSGQGADGEPVFKVAPFAGADGVVLPAYLVLENQATERAYTDGKVKPIAYDYRAKLVAVKPPQDTPCLEITAAGSRRFVDAVKITEKLDKIGNGRDVTATFSQPANRENVVSGEKLSTLFGKIAKWFSDLKAVAFSGKMSDLTDDATHRFVSDTEKTVWNDKYTKAEISTLNANLQSDINTKEPGFAKNTAFNRNFGTTTGTVCQGDDARLSDARPASGGNADTSKTLLITDSRPDYGNGMIINQHSNFSDSPEPNRWFSYMRILHPNQTGFFSEIATPFTESQRMYFRNMIGGVTQPWNAVAYLTDIPTSLPASDVHDWAKQPNKPNYAAEEVGAAPASHNHSANQIVEETDKRFMTDGERSKLSGIEAGANVYVHPDTHPATIVTESVNRLFMTDGERSKLSGIEAGANVYVHPDTHPATIVTESANRLFMTDGERSKLSGIEAGANVYVHPDTHSATIIEESANRLFMTDGERSKLATIESFNQQYSWAQVEQAVKKSLEDFDLNGATVNVEIVAENVSASGSITKENGSDRARFDFKIPVPKFVDTGWKSWILPPDSEGSFEVPEEAFWRYKNGILYLTGAYFRNSDAPHITPIFDLSQIPCAVEVPIESLKLLYRGLNSYSQEIQIMVDVKTNMIAVWCYEKKHEFYFDRLPLPLF